MRATAWRAIGAATAVFALGAVAIASGGGGGTGAGGGEEQRAANEAVDVIAFGSCAKEDRPQPIWYPLLEQQPDVVILAGDNIYGDSPDVDVLRRKWAELAAQPGFAKVRASSVVLATWDDHDYGENDAGREFAQKRESQEAFLDFLGEPADSARRQREGVYDAKVFGPEGKRVQVILLDTRTHRTALGVSEPGSRLERAEGRPGPYRAVTDEGATVLGEEQWAWLRERLMEPAEVRLIVSSIQVVADDHWFEKWGNFPRERERLLRLIGETKASGVVILSGDRHHAELSRLEAGAENPAGYPVYDLTSSPLNQTKRWFNEINRHRVGSVYSDENFGVVRIDWDRPGGAELSLEIYGLKGERLIRERVLLSELRAERGGGAGGR